MDSHNVYHLVLCVKLCVNILAAMYGHVSEGEMDVTSLLGRDKIWEAMSTTIPSLCGMRQWDVLPRELWLRSLQDWMAMFSTWIKCYRNNVLLCRWACLVETSGWKKQHAWSSMTDLLSLVQVDKVPVCCEESGWEDLPMLYFCLLSLLFIGYKIAAQSPSEVIMKHGLDVPILYCISSEHTLSTRYTWFCVPERNENFPSTPWGLWVYSLWRWHRGFITDV